MVSVQLLELHLKYTGIGMYPSAYTGMQQKCGNTVNASCATASLHVPTMVMKFELNFEQNI